MKGSRVQTVVRELNGERIDIVLWGDDPIAFVTRALSPAKVVHAELDEPDGKVTVVVADDQLSLAIGKGGQNARLAAKLTNLKIDLINESQYSERIEFQKLARFPVSDISGISEKLRAKLIAGGYETADQLSRASIVDLLEIEGIGEKTAVKVVDAAKAKISELREQFEAERAAAEAEAEEEEMDEEVEEAVADDDYDETEEEPEPEPDEEGLEEAQGDMEPEPEEVSEERRLEQGGPESAENLTDASGEPESEESSGEDEQPQAAQTAGGPEVEEGPGEEERE
jgi:N utilization substance protein A